MHQVTRVGAGRPSRWFAEDRRHCLSMCVTRASACAVGKVVALCFGTTLLCAGPWQGTPSAQGEQPTEPAAWWISDCNGVCRQVPACNGADVPCPGCDEWGDNTCSDTTLKQYNPGALAIMIGEHQGQECWPYRGVDDGDVICSRTQACVEGPAISFSMCSSGVSCVGTFPLPFFCQTCVASGAPDNYIIMNHRCPYDICCCEPDLPECQPRPI